jgi:hypothetical protein
VKYHFCSTIAASHALVVKLASFAAWLGVVCWSPADLYTSLPCPTATFDGQDSGHEYLGTVWSCTSGNVSNNGAFPPIRQLHQHEVLCFLQSRHRRLHHSCVVVVVVVVSSNAVRRMGFGVLCPCSDLVGFFSALLFHRRWPRWLRHPRLPPGLNRLMSG